MFVDGGGAVDGEENGLVEVEFAREGEVEGLDEVEVGWWSDEKGSLGRDVVAFVAVEGKSGGQQWPFRWNVCRRI